MPAMQVADATADGEVVAPPPAGPVLPAGRGGDVREEIAMRIRALLDDADVAEVSGDAVLAQALRADAARLVRGPAPAPPPAPPPVAVTARRAAVPRRPAARPTTALRFIAPVQSGSAMTASAFPPAPPPMVVAPGAPEGRPAALAASPAPVTSVMLANAGPPPAAPGAPVTRKRTRRLGALVGASAGWIVGGLIGNIPGLIIMGAATGIAGSKKTTEAAKQTVARDSATAAAAAAAAARDSTPRRPNSA